MTNIEIAAEIEELWLGQLKESTAQHKALILAYIIGVYQHRDDNADFLAVYKRAIERAKSITEDANLCQKNS